MVSRVGGDHTSAQDRHSEEAVTCYLLLALEFLFLGAVRTTQVLPLEFPNQKTQGGSLRVCISNASSGNFMLLQREWSGSGTCALKTAVQGQAPVACLKDRHSRLLLFVLKAEVLLARSNPTWEVTALKRVFSKTL